MEIDCESLSHEDAVLLQELLQQVWTTQRWPLRQMSYAQWTRLADWFGPRSRAAGVTRFPVACRRNVVKRVSICAVLLMLRMLVSRRNMHPREELEVYDVRESKDFFRVLRLGTGQTSHIARRATVPSRARV